MERSEMLNPKLEIPNCRPRSQGPPGPFGFRVSDFGPRISDLIGRIAGGLLVARHPLRAADVAAHPSFG